MSERGHKLKSILMLIPSYIKRDIQDEVAKDKHPVMDYYALQHALDADIADYAMVDNSNSIPVRLTAFAGKDAALAMIGFLHRKNYSAIYSNGENVSIPLAFLFLFCRIRPYHALIGHHPSTPKKRLFLKFLENKMDAIFTYSSVQQKYCITALGFPDGKVHLIPFHADHRFYRPINGATCNRICSAGLEWRDYPTLIEAVKDMNVEVCLAAASPWSKHRNETKGRILPNNVTARRYDYNELRDLYASSLFVVVPLYENDFQAGITTILEAMAMGKAVIATKTTGQVDVIRDGENGITVPPGDPIALRSAIQRLINQPDLAKKMGVNARNDLLANMTLDHWTSRIAENILNAIKLKTVDTPIS